jgi:hypothetical protein
MKTPAPQFAVTYGRLNFLPNEDGLETLFVETIGDVKHLALQFIRVIPDDPESYIEDVNKWAGLGPLVIIHQDDDSFYFSVEAIKLTVDLTTFSLFVQEFDAEG